jgi:spermidine synthase
VLLLLAFTGGITSLGLEIAASRLLAPYFGTTTPIWGALIGLILLYLTVGYFAGGWAADRWPRADYLYGVTAVASALVLLIPLLSRPLLSLSQAAAEHFSLAGFAGALLAVILLFAPSVILLGMVSPWVIRLRVEAVSQAGRAAGAVYAISTAGSILGAFLPAFWWIPSYGTRATIYGLGAVMLLVSVIGLISVRARDSIGLVVLCLLPLLPAFVSAGPVRSANGGILLYESDSEYGYIQVVQAGSQTQLILNEGHAFHSIYDPGNVRLTGSYWDYLLFAPLYGYRHWSGQAPRRILIIGLAGGTAARLLTATYGPVPIDGVEIDPRIIEAGRKYFDMTEPNLNAIVADGRYFLATTHNTYDVIIVDAYRQPYIPFQLTTREFFAECRRHLGANGVLAVNVGRGPNSDYRLVDAVSGTLTDVFPEVYQQDTSRNYLNTVVFATNQPTQPAEVHANMTLDRATYPPLLAAALDAATRDGSQVVQVYPHTPVYTDDRAPVERLVDDMVLRAITGS